MSIEIVIGEKINGSITKKDGSLGRVGRAIGKRDSQYIQKLAKRQIESGANYLDVHCGSPAAGESVGNPEAMEWLVKTVQEAVDVPLCIDSDNVELLDAGLAAYDYKITSGELPILNSLAPERAESILKMVVKRGYECFYILNCYIKKEAGKYASAEELVDEAKKLVEIAKRYEIEEKTLIVDLGMNPLIVPYAAYQSLEAVELAKQEISGVRTALGISNASFGIPERSLTNACMLFLAADKGLDVAILDPTKYEVMMALKLANAVYAGKVGTNSFDGMLELGEYTSYYKKISEL